MNDGALYVPKTITLVSKQINPVQDRHTDSVDGREATQASMASSVINDGAYSSLAYECRGPRKLAHKQSSSPA